MKTNSIVGHKIVAVGLQRDCRDDKCPNDPISTMRRFTHIDWIELDNGSRLKFSTTELNDGYGIEVTRWRDGREVEK